MFNPLSQHLEEAPEEHSRVREVVRASFLFQTLSDELIDKILPYFTSKSYQTGEPVFLEQEASDFVYLVLNGSVEIVKYHGSQGRLQRIIVFSNGESFSELSLLTASLHSTSAFALDDTELLLLHRDHFLQILEVFPAVGRSLIHNLASLNQQMVKVKDHVDSYREGLLQAHPMLSKCMPFPFIEQYQVIPLRYQQGMLLVGLRDPDNMAFFRAFRQLNPEINLRLCLITEKDFRLLKKTLASLYSGHSFSIQANRDKEADSGTNENTKENTDTRPRLLSEELWQSLKQKASLLHLKSGEVLFEVGSPSQCFYIVEQGEIELRTQETGGGSRHIAFLSPSAMISELSLILETPHTLSAKASRESKLWVISKEQFFSTSAKSEFRPSYCSRLSQKIAKKQLLSTL